jgi:hypothetical protein
MQTNTSILHPGRSRSCLSEFLLLGWGETASLWYCSSYWTYYPSPGPRMRQNGASVEQYWQRTAQHLEEHLPEWHFIYLRSRIYCPGSELGPSRRESGDWPTELWHGVNSCLIIILSWTSHLISRWKLCHWNSDAKNRSNRFIGQLWYFKSIRVIRLT